MLRVWQKRSDIVGGSEGRGCFLSYLFQSINLSIFNDSFFMHICRSKPEAYASLQHYRWRWRPPPSRRQGSRSRTCWSCATAAAHRLPPCNTQNKMYFCRKMNISREVWNAKRREDRKKEISQNWYAGILISSIIILYNTYYTTRSLFNIMVIWIKTRI